MKRNCVLSERHKDGCATCPPTCPHYIAMYGLSGTGGRVGAANLPDDYKYVTLANSPARTSQSKVYAMFDAYITTFKRQFDEEGVSSASSRIKSLYLYSESPGTGKTTSAAALINAWLVENYLGSLRRNRQPSQQPAYFLDVNAWQELYTGFTRPSIPQDIAEQNSRPYYRQLETAKRVPFVVLDDIGVRSASDGFRGDLHTIINYRCANGLPTVYTSNLPIEDMAKVFDARLYDRMRDMCLDIHFEGESRRGRR